MASNRRLRSKKKARPIEYASHDTAPIHLRISNHDMVNAGVDYGSHLRSRNSIENKSRQYDLNNQGLEVTVIRYWDYTIAWSIR